jgi:phage shock protein PspC (stress-responsive transcriptional regulator)
MEQTADRDVVMDQEAAMTPGRDPLHRSRSNRIIAGVCGGFARWLGWNPTTFRILYVVVSVLSAAFPGILVYLVLWVVMPNDAPRTTAEPFPSNPR